MRFLAALSFLTIIPLPRRLEFGSAEVGRSLVYFPVVGIAIGLILAALNWVLVLFLPSALVSGLLVVALVVIGGALHLDGFIDTCDGIAGQTVEARWRVMHDSRAGAFGIVGAFLLLLVKYLSLNSVPGNFMAVTLVLMPMVSHWAMAYAVFAFPYARPTGLGKVFKQETSRLSFTIATVATLLLATGLAWLAGASFFYLGGLAIMFSSWVIVVVLAAYLKRKFAGLTGDTYGAINEAVEVGVLVFVSLLAYNRWV